MSKRNGKRGLFHGWNKKAKKSFNSKLLKGRQMGYRIERLEPRMVLSTTPIISEFMASNASTINDGDGNNSDWIEIYNPTATEIDLAGWHLTDKDSQLDKWTFPDIEQSVLSPGEYLVVFASNQNSNNYLDTLGYLHTNFSLKASGEYLALTDDSNLVISEFAPEYPAQSSDVSYGKMSLTADVDFITQTTIAKHLIPDLSTATNWQAPTFDDSSWVSGLGGFGYENSAGGEYTSEFLTTTINPPSGSFYTRQEFTVTDPSNFSSLLLKMRYDDGFVAYLNGVEIERQNFTGTPVWDSLADVQHADGDAILFQEFNVSDSLSALVVGTNVLAIHAMNVSLTSSDMLMHAKLSGQEILSTDTVIGYMTNPTPGLSNQLAGPLISGVTKDPTPPTASQNLVIQATILSNGNGIAPVQLHYRVNYGSISTATIFDNGLGADAIAGDGVYTTTIAASNYSTGDMVRWYVTAEDTIGVESRAPTFTDSSGKSQSAEYFGTVVAGSTISTSLPVLQWFTENESASHQRTGTRASVFYAGQFYDNIFVRRRGGATNAAISQKFDFNPGDGLYVNEEFSNLKEININGNGADQSFLRQPLGFATNQIAGNPGSESFFTYMLVNGSYDRIGIAIEQVDGDYVERFGFDPNGEMYKFVQRGNLGPVLGDASTGIEKKLGDEFDFSSLEALVAGLALPTSTERQNFIRDNIDMAELVNFMAVRTIIHAADDIRKNFYLYQDSEGDGLWRQLPWDYDFTWNIPGGHDDQDSERTEHPFFGSQSHPTADGYNQYNVLYTRFFESVETQNMFLRRVRTLMDQLYRGASGNSTWFTDYVNEHFPTIDPHLGGSVTSGKNQLLADIEDRRHELYNVYTNNIPGYSTVIPTAQVGNPQIDFGTYEVDPGLSGQDAEYIELINNNNFSVDVSGWTLTGGVRTTLKAGTVIPANSSLYLTPDVATFRTRSSGPSGGQGLIFQQWDNGHLSNYTETITLAAADGTVLDTLVTPNNPNDLQEYLRVTELNYNPHAALTQFGEVESDNDRFEFIEFLNTSTTETLDLQGVHFDRGADFTFGLTPLSTTDFNIGTMGYSYLDDGINGTNNPSFSEGQHVPTGGVGGSGALRVYLPSSISGDDRGAASGTWSSTLNLAVAQTVKIDLDARMVLGHGFEADEYGEIFLIVDGTRHGNAENSSLLHVEGDGQDPSTPPIDSGWQHFNFTIPLTAGSHTITLGLYNNKSTFNEEDAEAFFDNVILSGTSLQQLAPGERILVLRDQAAFESRYGAGLNIAGAFKNESGLSNSGEAIEIHDASGNKIQEFEYNDSGNWPQRADGEGSSLVVIDTAGDYDNPFNWRASTLYGGTPDAVAVETIDVIINEVLAHTDLPDSDTIELYNTSASSIDLSNWWLSDSADDLYKYQFGSNVSLASGVYTTLNEADFNSSGGANATDFALSAAGDQVYLVAADVAGKPLRFADVVRFDATLNGITLGRVPNGDQSHKLFPLATSSLGTANGNSLVGDVIISEVHYHPADPMTGTLTSGKAEFIELYNRSAATIDMADWRLDGSADFTLPAGTMLAAGATLVVVGFDPNDATLTAEFRSLHNIGPEVALHGSVDGKLNNAAGLVRLLAPTAPPLGQIGPVHYLVDRVTYRDNAPWPTNADGLGDSLIRTSASAFGDFASSWEATTPTPGTAEFAPELLVGDFDGDNDVDGADFLTWQRGFGTLVGANASEGDANGDGAVDATDLALWGDHYGTTLPEAVTTSAPIAATQTVDQLDNVSHELVSTTDASDAAMTQEETGPQNQGLWTDRAAAWQIANNLFARKVNVSTNEEPLAELDFAAIATPVQVLSANNQATTQADTQASQSEKNLSKAEAAIDEAFAGFLKVDPNTNLLPNIWFQAE